MVKMTLNPELDLEIVQVFSKDGNIQVRCTPSCHEKSISMSFESLETAFAWLIAIVEEKHIRLFALRDLKLTNECSRIQLAMNPKGIERFSMTDISLNDIDPEHFQALIKGPFKAKKYTFTKMENVHPGSFCDGLLLSDVFLHAQTIEIHIASFLPEAEFNMTLMSEDAIIHWYFNNGNNTEPRIFVSNSVRLGPQFLGQLIRVFNQEIEVKPTSLVLYGQINQYQDYILDHLKDRRCLVVNNEITGEMLQIQYLMSEKLEFVRTIDNQNSKLRPIGRPAPGCSSYHSMV